MATLGGVDPFRWTRVSVPVLVPGQRVSRSPSEFVVTFDTEESVGRAIADDDVVVVASDDVVDASDAVGSPSGGDTISEVDGGLSGCSLVGDLVVAVAANGLGIPAPAVCVGTMREGSGTDAG